MHRFFLPPERCTAGLLTLDPTDSRHAARVLRLTAGEGIEVLDGAGRIHECRLVTVDKRATTAEVVARRRSAAPAPVGLAPALLKGRAMDFLVQKATELGAVSIQPLELERSVARVRPEELDEKASEWRRTATEACKQCGNPWLPAITPPRSLGEFLASPPDGMLVVASLRPEARSARDLFRQAGVPTGTVTLVIGPEGDFTPAEEAALIGAGARPLSLGPLVLRAETAALAGLAILQHERAAARI